MLPRILMVISYFHPFLGGAEQQALFLSENLLKKNLFVMVLTRAFKNSLPYEQIKGIGVYRKIHTIPYGKLFGLAYFFSCFWFLIRKRKQYDIIHCHLLQGFHSIAGVIMKYVFKKKIIILVGATGPLSDFSLIQKGFCGRFLLGIIRKADTVITLCTVSTQEALSAGFAPGHISQIPNGVDTSFFMPARSLPASPRLLFIGRLDHMKGVDVLLRCLASLRLKNIMPPCDILGTGPLKETLQTMAADLQIANQVNFPGAIHEVLPYLQRASCFVFPSRSEGMPNVLLEAMACALPVIATSVGGIPDIIQHDRNGLLIPSDDVEALTSALLRMLSDNDLAARLGNQGRRDAEEYFALEKVTDQYISLYTNLMTPAQRFS
jgi:glycosyltransferase involved in cell wall biosynthesis